jgi:hypothetical protein
MSVHDKECKQDGGERECVTLQEYGEMASFGKSKLNWAYSTSPDGISALSIVGMTNQDFLSTNQFTPYPAGQARNCLKPYSYGEVFLYKTTNSLVRVSEGTISTKRSPLIDEVSATFLRI